MSSLFGSKLLQFAIYTINMCNVCIHSDSIFLNRLRFNALYKIYMSLIHIKNPAAEANKKNRRPSIILLMRFSSKRNWLAEPADWLVWHTLILNVYGMVVCYVNMNRLLLAALIVEKFTYCNKLFRLFLAFRLVKYKFVWLWGKSLFLRRMVLIW